MASGIGDFLLPDRDTVEAIDGRTAIVREIALGAGADAVALEKAQRREGSFPRRSEPHGALVGDRFTPQYDRHIGKSDPGGIDRQIVRNAVFELADSDGRICLKGQQILRWHYS